MGARVANLVAFEKCSAWGVEGLTRIFTDDTDQERATAGSLTALLTRCSEQLRSGWQQKLQLV